ncbi:hypothetical protein EDM56_11645 [Brevibacillus fluminis]|uniref:Uncharacterized protein n=1 Tax=Brevibacillus fluminis TaxID=511487 RepID=A0A3M8DQT7_9BACL|nr:hypothetical protein [Brevibacillus fluminis]RNB89811.1 hypothetical protein EDM56_11645 [Brevibacillus fluminis]
MNWYELQKRNAKVTGWVAVFILLLGFGTAGYELWKNQADLTRSILLATEFLVLSLILFATAWRFNQKAKWKENARTRQERVSFFCDDQELMLKKAAGIDLCYQYYTVDGIPLLTFAEERKPLNKTFDLLLNLGPFLNRSFSVKDSDGNVRLILRQRYGLNSPVDVFMPDGERLARYHMSLKKFQLVVENEGGATIAVAQSEFMSPTFTTCTSDGAPLFAVFKRGMPARNQEYFSSSDDLIHFTWQNQPDKRLYLQIIMVPALLKMMYWDHA